VKSRVVIVIVAAGLAAGVALSAPRPGLVRVKANPTGEGEEKRAEAVIESKSGSSLTGLAVFTQKGNSVKLQINVQHAPPGTHAVHLHEKGDCTAPDALSAGPHWNPAAQAHGQWGHAPFHLGDIGNIGVGEDGVGSMTLITDLWSIGGTPETNVVGRAVVVHVGADDFTTQPTGNAGSRIGCGVVLQTF
jgi:Cu-Zn family superoxide dismutase